MMALQTLPQVFEGQTYVTSAEEIAWGALLTAATMALHSVGMLYTLRASTALKRRFAAFKPLVVGLASIILASWIIVLVHLTEVLVWALFFLWKCGMPNTSTAYYFALLEYTTLGSSHSLPLRWHMLEGVIAIAGMLTFAWSTGVVLVLARELEEQQMHKLERRRARRSRTPGGAHESAPASAHETAHEGAPDDALSGT